MTNEVSECREVSETLASWSEGSIFAEMANAEKKAQLKTFKADLEQLNKSNEELGQHVSECESCSTNRMPNESLVDPGCQ